MASKRYCFDPLPNYFDWLDDYTIQSIASYLPPIDLNIFRLLWTRLEKILLESKILVYRWYLPCYSYTVPFALRSDVQKRLHFDGGLLTGEHAVGGSSLSLDSSYYAYYSIATRNEPAHEHAMQFCPACFSRMGPSPPGVVCCLTHTRNRCVATCSRCTWASRCPWGGDCGGRLIGSSIGDGILYHV